MEMQYKDSRVDWIGQIPKNWNTEKFKHIFRIKKILAGKLGYDVLSVTQQGLKIKDITSNEGQVANDYSNYQLVFPGDFVMNHMDLLTGYVDVSKQEGVTSPDYRTFYAINKNNINKQYYLYIFQFCYKTRLFYNLGHGVSNLGRWRLPAEEQKEFMLPFPPLSEQQEIAKYLDSKCGEIDGLIALQEQMIAQLTDYKQSVITEAVTKGLNSDAHLVPSGIDRIGDIPKGWKVMPLKWLLKKPLQYGANESGVLYEESLPRYVRITDILDNNLREDLQKLSLTEEQAKGYILENNDILFARSGGTVGKAFIFKEIYGRCAFAGYLIRAQIASTCSSEYIYYYTQSQSYDEWKKQIFIQATIQNIGADRYSTLEVPVPSLDEQLAIVSYLDSECGEIDKLIATKRQKIETLKEYKKSVIYEAVTGKTLEISRN